MDGYSAREVGTAAGVSPEVLDYWQRIGLLPTPDGGYAAREVTLAIVLGAAARLGAAGPALAAVATALAGDPAGWPASLWLTSRGEVLTEDTAAAAIVLHVRRVVAKAGPLLLLALDSAAA